ncbi:DNA ligase I [Reticulomyxa filosa]|uniref:DNA ligase I n=1 Tax=Reticulomyxa filosa TaxID=46433 RepID=X6LTG8_RETFI|nr:DNA ligase I [Reticulomyxa filosa]|eukprot:ETO05233.1 DNA ligase I [Reticulomyxa filosa]
MITTNEREEYLIDILDPKKEKSETNVLSQFPKFHISGDDSSSSLPRSPPPPHFPLSTERGRSRLDEEAKMPHPELDDIPFENDDKSFPNTFSKLLERLDKFRTDLNHDGTVPFNSTLPQPAKDSTMEMDHAAELDKPLIPANRLRRSKTKKNLPCSNTTNQLVSAEMPRDHPQLYWFALFATQSLYTYFLTFSYRIQQPHRSVENFAHAKGIKAANHPIKNVKSIYVGSNKGNSVANQFDLKNFMLLPFPNPVNRHQRTSNSNITITTSSNNREYGQAKEQLSLLSPYSNTTISSENVSSKVGQILHSLNEAIPILVPYQQLTEVEYASYLPSGYPVMPKQNIEQTVQTSTKQTQTNQRKSALSIASGKDEHQQKVMNDIKAAEKKQEVYPMLPHYYLDSSNSSTPFVISKQMLTNSNKRNPIDVLNYDENVMSEFVAQKNNGEKQTKKKKKKKKSPATATEKKEDEKSKVNEYEEEAQIKQHNPEKIVQSLQSLENEHQRASANIPSPVHLTNDETKVKGNKNSRKQKDEQKRECHSLKTKFSLYKKIKLAKKEKATHSLTTTPSSLPSYVIETSNPSRTVVDETDKPQSTKVDSVDVDVKNEEDGDENEEEKEDEDADDDKGTEEKHGTALNSNKKKKMKNKIRVGSEKNSVGSQDNPWKLSVEDDQSSTKIENEMTPPLLLSGTMINELIQIATISPVPVWSKNRFKMHVKELKRHDKEYKACCNICRVLWDSLPSKQFYKTDVSLTTQHKKNQTEANEVIDTSCAQRLFRIAQTRFKEHKNQEADVPLFFQLPNVSEYCILCIIDAFYLYHEHGQCYVPRQYCIPVYLIRRKESAV